MKKRTWKNSWKNIFLYSSAVFSILGTFYTFLNDKLTLIIALVAVCLALTIIICIITRFFITWVEPQSGDRKTEKRSSFIKYEASNDAKKIVYEIYRLIQIKCSILSEYTYDFLWSGKNQPKISSKLQNFVRIQKSRNE
jgi:lipopolysaccharide export LptBFGC system permease protein LptF